MFEDVRFAKLLQEEMFTSARLKGFDILAYQIIPNHVHLLTGTRTLEEDGKNIVGGDAPTSEVDPVPVERTLESMRSGEFKRIDNNNFPEPTPIHERASLERASPERTFSKVRSSPARTPKPFTISDLIQSIKGNFSYKHKLGAIWQRRFYTKIVNTPEYLETVVEYIRYNPTKDGLPKRFTQPPYQYFDWGKIRKLF